MTVAKDFSVAYFPTYKVCAPQGPQGPRAGPCLAARPPLHVAPRRPTDTRGPSSHSPHPQIVTNLRNNETYVLRQCGAPQLPASAAPAGAKVFEVPLLSVSAADTTIIGFLVRG